ncbi:MULTISPECIES: DUF421 domain-containing protein [unclassified Paenibacillus]|uniref:DUF421 domain-containing protein n=1 Tax=unclassified Paenibacillus TaxID=185978 RepID=UPI001C0F6CFD|nr:MULTISPECIES: DUF421 domain-containing protein [unclassified Paenibacillus]MBU5444674.1 DUF421 domain-containing protein [Paenibacillus sp. MSJ-34]CAH0119135.1 hypothetical protein PAE9249_01632 [Paenibacillus sp. CECT 9249]
MPEWLATALRTLLSVAVLFTLTKLLGKRQVSQLSLFEYITGITIGSLTAYVSMDLEKHWVLGIVSLVVWVGVSLAIEFVQLKSKKIRDFVDGKGTVLIKDGKIMDDNMKKERITSDELLELLRKKNAFKAADVEFAVMEPSGELNVMLKKENQPLTPKHLGIKVGPEQEPQAVIMDGKILDEPLATLGLNRRWLHTELKKLGVSLDNVFVGQVDSYGQFYADLYDDQIKVPEPMQKASLYATLKKCEADLELYGLSTDEASVKELYRQCSEQMQGVIEDMKPLLTR